MELTPIYKNWLNWQISLKSMCLPLSPVLLGIPFHRWRRRVLELEPVPRAAADIRRAQALANNPLAAQPAGVAVGGRRRRRRARGVGRAAAPARGSAAASAADSSASPCGFRAARAANPG